MAARRKLLEPTHACCERMRSRPQVIAKSNAVWLKFNEYCHLGQLSVLVRIPRI